MFRRGPVKARDSLSKIPRDRHSFLITWPHLRAKNCPVSALQRAEPKDVKGREMSKRASLDQRRERAELDARYGKIGISAVAAALRYRSDSKNPVYAPVVPANEPVEDAAA